MSDAPVNIYKVDVHISKQDICFDSRFLIIMALIYFYLIGNHNERNMHGILKDNKLLQNDS